MHHLAAQISVTDPDTGAALRVVTLFDALTANGSSIPDLLHAAASITNAPVRLSENDFGVNIRVTPAGVQSRPTSAPDPAWPSVSIAPDGPAALWLERIDPPTLVDRMTLDRAPIALREVIRRTRRKQRSATDDITLLLDAAASEDDRLRAARRLGLPIGGPVRVILGAQPSIDRAVGAVESPSGRTGIGPTGTVLELPHSFRHARIARAFAAEGTDFDPGPRAVAADDLGSLALLVAALPADAPVPADVGALNRLTTHGALVCLQALLEHNSIRTAAESLHLHHSTLQTRIAGIERELGWPVHTPSGRLRLHLALVLRRYLLHPV